MCVVFVSVAVFLLVSLFVCASLGVCARVRECVRVWACVFVCGTRVCVDGVGSNRGAARVLCVYASVAASVCSVCPESVGSCACMHVCACVWARACWNCWRRWRLVAVAIAGACGGYRAIDGLVVASEEARRM